MWSISTIFSVLTASYFLISWKNIPFAWHFRFYKSLGYYLYVHKNKLEVEADPFRTSTVQYRSPAAECDLNGHKSNSTYFSDLDIARTDLMVDVFRKMLLDTKAKEGKWPYIPLGAVASIFRREIKPYALYNIKSRILGWDEKWLFVISRFESPSGKLHALSVTKYVFKLGRKTIAPKDALDQCGLWSPEIEKRGQEGRKKVQGFLDLDALEDEPF
ncbi:uncharacterized protein V1518DRAFT_428619 [Limtongia smithiae]|uniref:uncharacterized protein n=1 Tax=Limtongia smithiae TaxID=1125753 RepID=UPI0034CF248C